MEFLKIIILIFLFFSQGTWAASQPHDFKAPLGKKFCQSHLEFKAAFDLLNKEVDLALSEPQALAMALDIAKGCDGASLRFEKIFVLLKKSGVDESQALKTALKFVPLGSAEVEAFEAIFKRVFLENYLNMDFLRAFQLSLDMSLDYKGDAQNLANDVMNLVDYCLSSKGLGLDYKTCSTLTLDTVKHTELFPHGVYSEFKRVYEFLRFDKLTGLNMSESLKIVDHVLSRGVAAPDNFIATVRFLLTGPTPLRTPVIATALKVSDLSLMQDQTSDKK